MDFQGPPSGKNATGINEESNSSSVPLVNAGEYCFPGERSSDFKIALRGEKIQCFFTQKINTPRSII